MYIRKFNLLFIDLNFIFQVPTCVLFGNRDMHSLSLYIKGRITFNEARIAGFDQYPLRFI